METKPVKQTVLYNKIQIFLLESLLKESDSNMTENEKLAEYISKYSASFRALWLENEE